MRRLASLAILVFLLAAGRPPVHAASPSSDWPALNFDAAQSNDNAAEKAITTNNVLKLKVKWAQPIADASYPVVAAGRVYLPIASGAKIHVRALVATTGKVAATYPKDAFGGMLISGGNLYLAGHVLQAVNPSSGEKLVQINASPQFSGGTFLYPLADQKLLVAGYYSARAATKTALYAIDPQTNRVRWKVPSLSAEGSLGIGRILTQTLGGSEFYDESSGRGLAKEPRVSGDWFAGPDLAYTVALVKRTATLYAVDGTGRTVWHHAVGPYVATSGWAHAISASAVYVRRLAPSDGVAAYDPNSGKLLWSRHILNIQKLALANGILFVLTYSLGEPVRLIYLRADTGAVIGNRAVLLSAGYYAFSAPNELMVANGMLFIRAVGPKGSQLVALGL